MHKTNRNNKTIMKFYNPNLYKNYFIKTKKKKKKRMKKNKNKNL